MELRYSSRRTSTTFAGGALAGAALAVGALAASRPQLAGIVSAALAAVIIAVAAAERMPRVFVSCLGTLLVGYAFMGRSFAYLGAPPLFVGEIVLAVGVLTILVGPGLGTALRSPLIWLWLALALWGAARTLPYVNEYGIDALRDAVLWGYGMFALLVAAFLERSGLLPRVCEWYARWLPWFTWWAPFSWAVTTLGAGRAPVLPGTSIPIVEFNPSCMAVHHAGIATFLLLDLHRGATPAGREPKRRSDLGRWVVWFVGFCLIASWTRGGAMAAMASIAIVFTARPATTRKVGSLAAIALAVTLAFSALDLSFDTGQYRGKISPKEIAANFTSIIRDDRSDAANRAGTRSWRLEWWDKILDYTVHGNLFWVGKGFGVNLADDDGFQVKADHSLRSPHNGHLTFLARSGVPGAALWLLLQCAFGVTLVRAYLRARRARDEWWQRLDIWILSYWLAFLVNAAFDVFLEGPQGGIWFWSIFGFGIVAAEAQRRRFAVGARHGTSAVLAASRVGAVP
jgi:hypothetical protein